MVDFTDSITFIVSVMLMMRGFSRGFMLSLIGPISIIITTFISAVYYQATKDVVVSLLIGTIGPLILAFFLRFILKEWARSTNNDIKPNFLSCTAGALLTLSWGWVFIVFLLLLLTVISMPGNLSMAQNDILRSMSYTRIAKPLMGPLLNQQVADIVTSKSTDGSVKISNDDLSSIAQDPRFQKVIQDPQIQQEINAHDMVKLLGNPKILKLTQELMSDPAMLNKVLAAYRSQSATQSK